MGERRRRRSFAQSAMSGEARMIEKGKRYVTVDHDCRTIPALLKFSNF